MEYRNCMLIGLLLTLENHIHCTQQNITTTGTMTIFINRCKLCNEDNIIIDIKGNVGLRINSIMGNKKIEYALSSFEQEQKDIVISDIAV